MLWRLVERVLSAGFVCLTWHNSHSTMVHLGHQEASGLVVCLIRICLIRIALILMTGNRNIEPCSFMVLCTIGTHYGDYEV